MTFTSQVDPSTLPLIVTLLPRFLDEKPTTTGRHVTSVTDKVAKLVDSPITARLSFPNSPQVWSGPRPPSVVRKLVELLAGPLLPSARSMESHHSDGSNLPPIKTPEPISQLDVLITVYKKHGVNPVPAAADISVVYASWLLGPLPSRSTPRTSTSRSGIPSLDASIPSSQSLKISPLLTSGSSRLPPTTTKTLVLRKARRRLVQPRVLPHLWCQYIVERRTPPLRSPWKERNRKVHFDASMINGGWAFPDISFRPTQRKTMGGRQPR